MTIETLEDWNDWLACCCEMPSCPVPTMECQSMERSADACEDGVNEDYDPDWNPTCQAPFSPAGANFTDPLPAIYRRIRNRTEYDGVEGVYSTILGSGPAVGCSALADPGRFCDHKVVTHATGQEPVIVFNFGNGFWWFEDPDDPLCDPPGDGQEHCVGSVETLDLPGPPITHTGTWVPLDNDCTTTATAFYPANSRSILSYGTPQPVPSGCPSNWTPADTGVTWAVDLIESVGAYTVDDPIDVDQLRGLAEDKFPAEWPSPVESTWCLSAFISNWPTYADINQGIWPDCENPDFIELLATSGTVTVRKTRFRWVVPEGFQGSYFKITWDVVEDPDEGASTFYLTDQTWEWAGPADPEDPASRKSGWFEIPAPTDPGTRRVVNVRFECYRSPFGNKPQTTGEAVEL